MVQYQSLELVYLAAQQSAKTTLLVYVMDEFSDHYGGSPGALQAISTDKEDSAASLMPSEPENEHRGRN